jgi:hypothetical protein
MQVLQVGTPESAHVGGERRSRLFGGATVNLASAITIIIPGPFVGTLAHDGTGSMAAAITLPFVRESIVLPIAIFSAIKSSQARFAV